MTAAGPHGSYLATVPEGTGRIRPLRTDGPLVTRLSSRLAAAEEDIPRILREAWEVASRLPNPEGPPSHKVGLMLGRIQAGKTNAMIATAAMAADNGYKLVIVLTSDNTWLYSQTLSRFKQALPGITCVGMEEFTARKRQIETALQHSAALLVTTKNRRRLEVLLRLLNELDVRDAPTLIFDDEADQASLNTNAAKPGSDPSPINHLIGWLRKFFYICGFVQVTATPQAILLQDPDSEFRPEFIVLLEPGSGYVGGDVYFADDSPYLRAVPLDELAVLKGHEPVTTLPAGLRRALCTFFMAASARLAMQQNEVSSCLVHVSLSTAHHERLRELVQTYVDELARCLRSAPSLAAGSLYDELHEAYADLGRTAETLPPFEDAISLLRDYINGTDIQVLNSDAPKKQPSYDALFNVLIGGTKLGRGVTIRGLLVTYYGRESKSPKMDTVQQHARMYGYRKRELPFSRIFLPDELARYFRDINQSENELREWLASVSDTRFHPLTVPSGMKPTRENVLNPATVGFYLPGRSYTPGPGAFVHFSDVSVTQRLDTLLGVPRSRTYAEREVTVDFVLEVLRQVKTPPGGRGRWDDDRIAAALQVLKEHCGNRAHLLVFAGRNLRPNEKPNVADSDDLALARKDVPALLMFRQDGKPERGWKGVPFWIPVVRFPDGHHPIAFNFA